MEDITCSMCGCEEPVWLGSLGKLAWFRCRNCGWELSVPVEEINICFLDLEGIQDGSEGGE